MAVAVVFVVATAGRVPYEEEMAAIAGAAVGDIVSFGSYEQDNNPRNGTEPVDWYVLDKADGEATLLAVDLLDCRLLVASIARYWE